MKILAKLSLKSDDWDGSGADLGGGGGAGAGVVRETGTGSPADGVSVDFDRKASISESCQPCSPGAGEGAAARASCSP